ncbi:zinc metallopeptidase [Flavobacterium sp.]|uniref:zinc metallopeptidase n=1 Tax=Flavobacterium sp. TaxID=239 RepID=UPI00122A4086|nr:zinc metallopeptidase [Flavobacterium sp.]RZJ69140.1 MAG: zinc metallopeptidase [Flavobacterium sp.]
MNPIYILIIAIMIASWAVGQRLQSKFTKYSKLQLRNGMSGSEIAQKMLDDHGIRDVRVISTPGRLTDHYNPADKTVNLSEAVYNERNAAAAAVAAHEVGHAVQHARAYNWLTFRSNIVPAVSLISKFIPFVLIAGVLTLKAFPQLLLIGIALFALTTIFTFITLPVEYDASNRALAWLENKNMVTREEHDGAKDALKWAARTYVVAAISSLATLLYYISIYNNRR